MISFNFNKKKEIWVHDIFISDKHSEVSVLLGKMERLAQRNKINKFFRGLLASSSGNPTTTSFYQRRLFIYRPISVLYSSSYRLFETPHERSFSIALVII